MGLRMDSIHSTTVPAGPTSANTLGKGVRSGKQSLHELITQKERIESEMSALSSVLDSVRSLYKRSVYPCFKLMVER